MDDTQPADARDPQPPGAGWPAPPAPTAMPPPPVFGLGPAPLPPPAPPTSGGTSVRTVLIVVGASLALLCACGAGVVGLISWQLSQAVGSVFSHLVPATPRPGEVGSVYAVAFAPDGNTVAAGHGGLVLDHMIRLWDVRDPHAAPVVLQGHTGTVDGLAFSPDGRTLASVSEDRTLRLWTVRAPGTMPVIRTNAKGERFNGVAFSPDGQWLAAGSWRGVHLWRAGAGATAPALDLSGSAQAVAFSPDSRTLAGAEQGQLQFWDPRDPQASPTVVSAPGLTLPVTSLVYSPDGRHLAAASPDGVVRLWDLTALQARPTMLRLPPSAYSRFPPDIPALAFSPDGQTLVAACSDDLLRLWDMRKLTAAPVIWPHQGAQSVAFSPDGAWLASGGLGLSHGEVRVWPRAQANPTPIVFPDPQTYPYQEPWLGGPSAP